MENGGRCQRNWQIRFKTWGFRIALILLSTLWLAVVASSWAEAKNEKSSDEYSFKWLDPEKKIYVLQNRRYLKASRLLLSLLGGTGLSNPYRSSYHVEPRLGFYFTEAWGVEFFYSQVFNSPNNVDRALKNTGAGTFPAIREIGTEYGGIIHWVPWYAKINVFNEILYFDWYFSGGAGAVNSEAEIRDVAGSTTFINQNFLGVYAGTGHQYHLSQAMSVRLDLTGAFFQAPVFGNSGENVWFSNFKFSVGLGLRL